MNKITLVKVGPDNLEECGIGCLSSPKNQGFQPKIDWLRRRFAEGLGFFLFRNEKGKPLAFLEYVPGEFAWRPVEARDWLFIHCLWVYPAGLEVGGLGGRLIHACLDEARHTGTIGAAVVVSDGPWMVDGRIFQKHGFEQIDRADRFQLTAFRLKPGPSPRFLDISGRTAEYQGLHIVYSHQCPMLAKSVNDLSEMAAEYGLEIKVTILQTAKEAQNAPSYYGVFNLLWNGRLLSDHYVSKGRFRNILQKQILQLKK